jgi:hypothetical protein
MNWKTAQCKIRISILLIIHKILNKFKILIGYNGLIKYLVKNPVFYQLILYWEGFGICL